MTIDDQLRRAALNAVAAARSRDEMLSCCLMFGVSERSIRRWNNALASGTFIANRRRGPLVNAEYVMNAIHFEFISDLLDANCDLLTDEIIALVSLQFGKTYSDHQIRNAFYQNHFTRKIIQNHARQQDAYSRNEFRTIMRPQSLGGMFSAEMMMFVDESHCTAEVIYRKYGRSRSGFPAFKRVVFNPMGGQSTSVIATLTITGVQHAIDVIGMNTADMFLIILETRILPSMRPYPEPVSVLILDNAQVHDHRRIYALCQRFGVFVLFLPTYSYDFNPIELIFHLAKNALGLHGRDAGVMPLSNLFKQAIYGSVTPSQACNLFQHCFIEITHMHRVWSEIN
jgi:hypothetical protein